MIGVAESLLTLVGDALSAAGAALRSRREGFAECEAGEYLMTSAQMPRIPLNEVRAVFDALPDSTLIRIGASIIAGWKPIVLKATDGPTDVDVLVDALRDRATQFHICEDAEQAFPPAPAT